MELSLTVNEKEFRELLDALGLPPDAIKKGAAAGFRKEFDKLLNLYIRRFHFSGSPAGKAEVGRVGKSIRPGKYGHLQDSFRVRSKITKQEKNFGMYFAVDSSAGKSDHAFILPMHEYGTGDRYRNRRASRGKFGDRPGYTGRLPARHPFESAINSYLAGGTLEPAVVKAIERAVMKAAKGALT